MLKLIAAVGKKGELGKDGDLCWRLAADMKFFRETTMGASVVMGYRTWLSLPGALKGRKNFVVSREAVELPEGVELVTDLSKFFVQSAEHCSAREAQAKPLNTGVGAKKPSDVFVIGGGSIYQQALPYVQEIYLTEIEAECPGADTFFPEFDKSKYCKEVLGNGEENGVKFTFVKYIKL